MFFENFFGFIIIAFQCEAAYVRSRLATNTSILTASVITLFLCTNSNNSRPISIINTINKNTF